MWDILDKESQKNKEDVSKQWIAYIVYSWLGLKWLILLNLLKQNWQNYQKIRSIWPKDFSNISLFFSASWNTQPKVFSEEYILFYPFLCNCVQKLKTRTFSCPFHEMVSKFIVHFTKWTANLTISLNGQVGDPFYEMVNCVVHFMKWTISQLGRNIYICCWLLVFPTPWHV